MQDAASSSADQNLSNEVESLFKVGTEEASEVSDDGDLVAEVGRILNVDEVRSRLLVEGAGRLYISRMRERFSELRVSKRLKRTNPFLLRIRGARTVRDWATLQVQSALYASEEEAVGHLLELVAKTCFPNASEPAYPDDFDFEAPGPNGEVHGYQVKMSWDCMPMSSRKNLSNTIRHLRDVYGDAGREFVGFFAPCYGRALTSKAPGQDYVSLASREFWSRVGNGDEDFDVSVGKVCALLCAEFRLEILASIVPKLLDELTAAAIPEIGEPGGGLDYAKLFRRINR